MFHDYLRSYLGKWPAMTKKTNYTQSIIHSCRSEILFITKISVKDFMLMIIDQSNDYVSFPMIMIK